MGNRFYYLDGTVSDRYLSYKILHREDGPAIEWADGGKTWYQNNKRHRLDGPARERSPRDVSWYIDGKCLSEEEFNRHPEVIKYQMIEVMDEG